MEQGNPDMRSLKAAAKQEFGGVEGVEGVGLGEGSLRVYVRDAKVRKQLPTEFRGVAIEPVVTGEISAMDPNLGPVPGAAS
jgi:hypothetical protein